MQPSTDSTSSLRAGSGSKKENIKANGHPNEIKNASLGEERGVKREGCSVIGGPHEGLYPPPYHEHPKNKERLKEGVLSRGTPYHLNPSDRGPENKEQPRDVRTLYEHRRGRMGGFASSRGVPKKDQ